MITVLFLLLAGHAIADYALQSDWMAKNKNRHLPAPVGYDVTIHGPMQTIWPYVLGSHALIHGAFVYIATQSAALGFAEAVAHAAIDFGKCEKKYGIHTDQALHLACKALWLILWARGMA
jgi:hypothetical protein